MTAMLIPDDLSIPAFLHREPTEITTRTVKSRERKIAYPKDGYACKGKGQKYRERHRNALRRAAERMTETAGVKRKRRAR